MVGHTQSPPEMLAGDAPADHALDSHAPTAIDRRELLLAVSALASLFALPGAAKAAATPATIDLAGFRDLTAALTGYSPRDASLPALFLDAFAADVEQLAELHAIVRETPDANLADAIKSAGLDTLASTLVQSWYTGTIGQGDEERVLTYLDAFVWYACGYTKPPTRCDTNFGAWADAPPPGRFSE